jgi:hypothetical protein
MFFYPTLPVGTMQLEDRYGKEGKIDLEGQPHKHREGYGGANEEL